MSRIWLVLLFPLVLPCISCQKQSAPSSGTANTSAVLPGTAWSQWRQQPPSHFDGKLLAALDDTVARWPAKFTVMRVASNKAPQASDLRTCYPFEKEHRTGQAVDLAVGDVNGDGKINLLDACLVAHQIDAAKWRGGIGVYGHTNTKSQSVFWVHLDQGKVERWGGWRNQTPAQSVASQSVASQPVIWSRREQSLRQRAERVRGTRLRVVVEKQPSAWYFDAENKALSLHPAVRVYAGQRLLKAYPAALGSDPIGDKQQRNDYRTPEGEFYLCDRNPRSRFFLSLRLSYPNAEDAARGLRAGLIDQRTHDAIARALRRRRVPPQNTRLGGDIMLHGGGIGTNWTWGCVALENAAITELFETLPIGTPITVKAPQR